MRSEELFKARHKVTGIVSKVPATYLDIYPDVYEVMDVDSLAKLNQEVEEEKTIFALDAAEKPAHRADKKEGK